MLWSIPSISCYRQFLVFHVSVNPSILFRPIPSISCYGRLPDEFSSHPLLCDVLLLRSSSQTEPWRGVSLTHPVRPCRQTCFLNAPSVRSMTMEAIGSHSRLPGLQAYHPSYFIISTGCKSENIILTFITTSIGTMFSQIIREF